MYYHLRQPGSGDPNYTGEGYMLRTTDLDFLCDPADQPKARSENWFSGEPRRTPFKTPIEIELDDTYGTLLPDYLDESMCVMSKRMVAALRRAGVDNLELFDAVLVDPNRNQRFTDYYAVQIIGRMSIVDKAASDAHDPLGVGHTMVQYRKLVIDEKKARGQKLFRLHERVTTVVVNEDVKRALDEAALVYVNCAKFDALTF